MFLCVVHKISVRKLCFRTDCGGRNRTRTCDPIDVNDVLYQLSHATIFNCRHLNDRSYYTISRRGCQGLGKNIFCGVALRSDFPARRDAPVEAVPKEFPAPRAPRIEQHHGMPRLKPCQRKSLPRGRAAHRAASKDAPAEAIPKETPAPRARRASSGIKEFSATTGAPPSGAASRACRSGKRDRRKALPPRASFHAASKGSRTVKAEPSPGRLSTVTLPPQRSAMRLTRLSPSPLPSVAWAVSPW